MEEGTPSHDLTVRAGRLCSLELLCSSTLSALGRASRSGGLFFGDMSVTRCLLLPWPLSLSPVTGQGGPLPHAHHNHRACSQSSGSNPPPREMLVCGWRGWIETHGPVGPDMDVPALYSRENKLVFRRSFAEERGEERRSSLHRKERRVVAVRLPAPIYGVLYSYYPTPRTAYGAEDRSSCFAKRVCIVSVRPPFIITL